MARNRVRIKHYRTSNGESIPTKQNLEYGELAVRYADGSEALFIKNTNDVIVEVGGAGYAKYVMWDFPLTESMLEDNFTNVMYEWEGHSINELIDVIEGKSVFKIRVFASNGTDYILTPNATYKDLEEGQRAILLSTQFDLTLPLDNPTEPTQKTFEILAAIQYFENKIICLVTSNTKKWSVDVDVEPTEGSLNPIASNYAYESSLVVAAALNDLNYRKLDASAYTPTDLSNYYTKAEVDEKIEEHEPDLSDYYTKEEVDEKIEEHEPDLSDYYTKEEIDDSALVISAALNELNDRKLDASAYTPTDLSDYYTKEEVDGKISEQGNTHIDKLEVGQINMTTHSSAGTCNITGVNKITASSGEIASLTSNIVDASSVNVQYMGSSKNVASWISQKLDATAYTPTDLSNYYTKDEVDDAILPFFDDAAYVDADKKIYFYHNDNVVCEINAEKFIKDGMVNTVSIGQPTSGSHQGEDCLIITFNTDAGKEDIEIPLEDLFDADNYYDKNAIDRQMAGKVDNVTFMQTVNALDTNKLDVSAFSASMESYYTKDEINETELVIATSLNDLNDRKLDESAFTRTLADYYTADEVDEKLDTITVSTDGITIKKTVDNELYAADAVLENSFRVLGVEVGNLKSNDVISAGTTVWELLKRMLVKVIDVHTVNPKCTLGLDGHTNGEILEVDTIVPYNSTWSSAGTDGSFVGDEGYDYTTRAGCYFVNVSYPTIPSSGYSIQEGVNTFTANVDYSSSTTVPVKNDGTPSDVRISEGSLSPTFVINGRYKYVIYNSGATTSNITSGWLTPNSTTLVTNTFSSNGDSIVIDIYSENYLLDGIENSIGASIRGNFNHSNTTFGHRYVYEILNGVIVSFKNIKFIKTEK